ncbi:DoxX family protein [Hymenobacter sp. BT186]|uniref:DoxX family protein n=1 Tax=Hymenobacter telluris TaxID=2816474 RepID=A0A939ESM7_9BACT|nr:DoxX family protein [Hymenobacter telluris]MBO0356537.1 DoxX family protein [Hymenobacter telluris]MBW3372562.1 DoxX family protein [Hymenobacter norwichensis]
MKKLLFAAQPFPSYLADAAWLLFRLHLGLSIAIGAGWSKLVNLTTTHEAAKLATGSAPLGPPDWFVQQVANLGFTYPSPYMWAWLAAWGEFAGGLLVALGLLTRWASLQLAVQFLVIAFVWYEAPEPVLGMYYQQLLFWAFVLVTVVGGGRYSLDYWWLRGSGSSRFLNRLVGHAPVQVVTMLLVVLGGSVAAQTPTASNKVTMPELQAVVQQWDGTLTYLDYKTQKQVSLVTTLNGMQSKPRELVLDFIYREPEGGQVKGYDKVQLAADGLSVTWDGIPMRIVRKTRLPNQELKLVLEGRGRDDNKDCLIRKTVMLGVRQFTIVKEVKYDNNEGFITRNTYAFQQKQQ